MKLAKKTMSMNDSAQKSPHKLMEYVNETNK